jgi:hypothetical protein
MKSGLTCPAPANRVEGAGLRVEAKEDGGIGPGDVEGLGGNRRHDVGGIEAPHERLAGAV